MNASDEAVTTVALLARRTGQSVDLFSRYWRDVHGVLAVRIPGFWSYTQYHVTPVSVPTEGTSDFVMDGFAEVGFAKTTDRDAMGSSDVIPLILRDELNVFSRTLLYGLEAGASLTYRAAPERTPDYSEPDSHYVLVGQSPPDASAEDVANALDSELIPLLASSAELTSLRRHLLASGDPSQWNTAPGVDNAEHGLRNSVVIRSGWAHHEAALAALDTVSGARSNHFPNLQIYRVTARCAMVAQGRPTHLGLRGLDVWRTINEAGADNQKEIEVLQRIYGPDIQAPATE